MELLKYSISLQLDIFFQKQKNGLREDLPVSIFHASLKQFVYALPIVCPFFQMRYKTYFIV